MAIIQNKPNMNYGVWGSNGNIAVPTSEKVDSGWIIERPPNEVMNWVQNRQDSMLQFINQRGIPTWDALTEYPLNAYVVRSGTLYKAISQNIDKDPTLNSAIWNVAFVTYSDYSNLYNDVQKIKNEDGYLANYVSKNNPVMLGEAKGVAYKDSEGSSGLAFSGTTPIVMKDNAIVAIFDDIENLSESSKKVVTMDVLLQFMQVYKVGDIYATTNPSNPSVTLGYGTWERFGEGRALVSMSTKSSDPSWTKGIASEFGDYTHKLTEAELPSHRHDIAGSYEIKGQGVVNLNNGSAGLSAKTAYTGEDQPHNIVQPSVTLLVWRRTA